MNDLFSTSSFKKFADLKLQINASGADDIESGGSESLPGGPDMERFFKDVESIKEEIKSIEQLRRSLQDLNEETKTAYNATTMKKLRGKMDAGVDQVLRRAKAVKQRLEALDRANAASRMIAGCGPGSSADRTRTSVVAGLGKKLKDLMDEFQGLRGRIAAEYRETVGRRYYTVTGERADEETVEALISSGDGDRVFEKAVEAQGRGQVMDAISEMKERSDAVREIEKSLLELHQVFLDMAALVEAQGQQINDIESHVARASSFVRKGGEELCAAREYQKGSRKWCCLAFLLGTVLIVLLLMPILFTVFRPV